MRAKPGFEEDIFISYAHIDNLPLDNGLKGWVETFHERLKIRLMQLMGEEVKIWRDRKLQGNDVFEETLTGRIANVALLVSVLSPRYLKSEWCIREIDEFCKQAALSGGLQVGDKLRVFKVLKTHVPPQEHPPVIQGLLGYEFYEYDSDRGRAREFRPEVAPSPDIRYWEKLDDLAYDIKHLIESLKTSAVAPGPLAQAAPDGKTVYLAETTSDLRDERERVKRELQQHGHNILPDRELPLVGDSLKATIREFLDRSDLSVHLMGARYGVIPEGESRSVVHLQSALAAERGGLRQIIWIPPGLETPEDQAQQRLLDSFRLESNGHGLVDVLQTRLEELKTFIQDNLNAKSKPASAAPGGGQGRSVYLVCDRQDIEATQPVADHLFALGMNVILPLMTDPAAPNDEALALQDHKDNLLECDAVLIYYGRASEIWLRMKQREMQKLVGYGRTKPLLAKALYVSGPRTDAKERLRDHETLIIKNYDAFSPESLRPFV
ncbi:MAG TPA: TIR domain-containing protein, partial [Blastocatellia bacterium]|nr:TIR domain-containing protein [Blastocatellia bacterium]